MRKPIVNRGKLGPAHRLTPAFPAKSLHDDKFWPQAARADNVFGDRNPVCSCVGMENYS